MDEKELELRMYFFVNYQLMGIQKGIQCGHAALEYADKYHYEEQYIRFIRRWKTWIILNGGTTNTHRDLDGVVRGTLDQIGDSLLEHDIQMAYFQEPDLNDALTAVCFIADERVWNREKYPDFIDYLCQVKNFSAQESIEARLGYYPHLLVDHADIYDGWLDIIGGSKNLFLRELIKDKKLA